MQKSKGSVLNFMTVCITLLAMSCVIMVYFNLSELLVTKQDISQVTRKYILRMETKGYLDAGDKVLLEEELRLAGMKEIDLSGSTLSPVTYGETIRLTVKGTISGTAYNAESWWLNGFEQKEYVVEEKRTSTAKN